MIEAKYAWLFDQFIPNRYHHTSEHSNESVRAKEMKKKINKTSVQVLWNNLNNGLNPQAGQSIVVPAAAKLCETLRSILTKIFWLRPELIVQ